MVQRKIIFAVIFSFSISLSYAQIKLLDNLQLELTGSVVDNWKARLDYNRVEENDGFAVGVGLKYKLGTSNFLQFHYRRAFVTNSVLNMDFDVPYVSLFFGRDFKVGERNWLSPKVGYAIIGQPNYAALIREDPVTGKVNILYFPPSTENWGNLAIGLEYAYQLSSQWKAGLKLDLYTEAFGSKGTTLFSFFIRIPFKK